MKRQHEGSSSSLRRVAILGKWLATSVAVWLFLAFRLALERIRYDRLVDPTATFSHLLLNTLGWFIVTALLAPLIFTLAGTLDFHRGSIARASSLILGGFFLFVFINSFCRVIFFPVHHPTTGAVYPRDIHLFRIVFVDYLYQDSFTYLPIVALGVAYRYYRENQQRELSQSKLKGQLAEAQLHILKMQLHPHFLFNTLHTIAGLVDKKPETAKEMIVSLSELLRAAISNESKNQVPLKDELEVLERYIDIERLRFEDRLEFRFEVDPAALGASVPTLLLQPIVENAVKYGAGELEKGGIISVRCRIKDNRLRIAVRDNGPGASNPICDKVVGNGGLGLKNAQARLTHLYGDEASIRWDNLTSGGFEVKIEIPLADLYIAPQPEALS